jgi:hypothetical protein
MMLASIANDRCVDDRSHLLDVVEEEAVEEHLVTVLESSQVDVLVHLLLSNSGAQESVAGMNTGTQETRISASNLLLDGHDTGGEKATDAKAISLTVVKSDTLGSVIKGHM